MCREGVGEIFARIKTLNNYCIDVLSYQEQWLQGMAAMADLFISMLGWVAGSIRPAHARTKAGLAKRRLEGKGKRGPDHKKRKTRVIKRSTNFTPDTYAWPKVYKAFDLADRRFENLIIKKGIDIHLN